MEKLDYKFNVHILQIFPFTIFSECKPSFMDEVNAMLFYIYRALYVDECETTQIKCLGS